MKRHGALLSAADIAASKPEIGLPLWGTYRGYRIASNPPPGGGVKLMEMLNILEHFDLAPWGTTRPPIAPRSPRP